MAEVVSPETAVMRFVEALHQKGAKSVEFGWYPIGADEHEPAPGEPVRWWAKVTMPGVRVYHAVKVGTGAQPLIDALQDASRQAGLNVQIEYR